MSFAHCDFGGQGLLPSRVGIGKDGTDILKGGSFFGKSLRVNHMEMCKTRTVI